MRQPHGRNPALRRENRSPPVRLRPQRPRRSSGPLALFVLRPGGAFVRLPGGRAAPAGLSHGGRIRMGHSSPGSGVFPVSGNLAAARPGGPAETRVRCCRPPARTVPASGGSRKRFFAAASSMIQVPALPRAWQIAASGPAPRKDPRRGRRLPPELRGRAGYFSNLPGSEAPDPGIWPIRASAGKPEPQVAKPVAGPLAMGKDGRAGSLESAAGAWRNRTRWRKKRQDSPGTMDPSHPFRVRTRWRTEDRP